MRQDARFPEVSQGADFWPPYRAIRQKPFIAGVRIQRQVFDSLGPVDLGLVRGDPLPF